MNIERIPQELRSLPHWHNWIDKDGTKLPTQCLSGHPAKSNDPATWSDFLIAVQCADRFDCGLAFEITSPYTGVDLDNCLDDKGKLRDWAVPVVARLSGVSYAEISPSGRGIKFLTRARKHDGARCSIKMGPDKQQLECYDHARFWTVTGDVYAGETDLSDGQKAIDWICQEYLAPVAPAPHSPPVDYLRGWASTPLTKRAEDYVSNAENCGAGGRNNAAFRLAGHLWSMTGDFGERLDADQILNLMRGWNSHNLPPMDDAELQAVTSSAGRNGTPRPPKISQPMPQVHVDPDVDLSGITGEPKTESTAINLSLPITLEELKQLAEAEAAEDIVIAKPIPLPDKIYTDAPGFIGEYYRFLHQHAENKLPEAFLSAALSVLSAVSGRTHCFPYKQWVTQSNLYSLVLAPSGAGKDFARGVNEKLINAVDNGLRGGLIVGTDDFASSSAIVAELDEYPRRLWQIDEFSEFIDGIDSARSGQHLKEIRGLLLKLYTSAGRENYKPKSFADRRRNVVLNRPHAVIYGTSTPDGFWQSLSISAVRGGLAGRILIFEDQYCKLQASQSAPKVDADGCVVMASQESLCEFPNVLTDPLVDCLSASETDVKTLRIDARAFSRLDEHERGIRSKQESDSPLECLLWQRAGEKTSKLAMLAAIARQSDVISLEDVDWAILLVNALTRRMANRVEANVSENIQDANVKFVYQQIAKTGAAIRRDLTRRTQKLSQRDRTSILSDLVESEQVKTVFLARRNGVGQWFGTSYRAIFEASSRQ